MSKYWEWREKDRTLAEEQIFNNNSDISRGYKRFTFDSLTDPLAT
jgi:hypothetical protein